MIWVAIISWLLIGVFGVFYNISFVDEAKYLIKGWLMATGQVGYYSTPEFFYQHMPGGLLWFGWGQKLFGPSLLVGRFQSLFLSGLILWLTYLLTKNIAGKTAAKLSLLVLSLALGTGLYYAAATPHALAVTVLLLALIAAARKKYLLASFWFSLAFIVRENFLFTLIIYLGFLIWQLKMSRSLLKNLVIITLTLAVFFAPGWPGILKVLYNFPGVSWLLPISSTQRAVLGLNWQIQNYDLSLYVRAVEEFGVIYLSFIISFAAGAFAFIKQKVAVKFKPAWSLLLIIAGFNLLAHTWGAFQLTPRAIVSYFAYVAPLAAVIAAVCLKTNPRAWFKLYPFLLALALVTNRYSSVAGHLNRPTDLQEINRSIPPLKELTHGKNKIIWLTEPMALYLAGKVSYYPLINHTNFFKPSDDTATVQLLGFWNLEMMSRWLDQADLVVIDTNRISILNQNPLTQPVVTMIENSLQTQFIPLTVNPNVWPGNLRFYVPGEF